MGKQKTVRYKIGFECNQTVFDHIKQVKVQKSDEDGQIYNIGYLVRDAFLQVYPLHQENENLDV